MPETDQPMNSQQMAALNKQFSEKLTTAIKDVDLRKWSVDQACGIAGAAFEAEAKPVDVLDLARGIHAFLTEEAKAQ